MENQGGSAQADAMDVEDQERLDSLHEKLQQAKALHSINPAQAEAVYRSLVAEGLKIIFLTFSKLLNV